MVSHHLVSQLVLLALLWLFVILHLSWPKRAVTAPAVPTEPEPLQPKRSRSNEPRPFEGLIQKPHCALCERDAAYPKPPPPVPPDPMAPTNRRPREVDTSMHFCPHSDCDYRGWLGFGNLRANGHPSGGPWRQFHCTSCQGYFLETPGTIFHGNRSYAAHLTRSRAGHTPCGPRRMHWRLRGRHVLSAQNLSDSNFPEAAVSSYYVTPRSLLFRRQVDQGA